MMRLNRFWNHHPEAKRYIRRVSRLDYGVISSSSYCEALRSLAKAVTYKPIRAGTLVHAGSATTLSDAEWTYLDGDMAVVRSGGIVVLGQEFPVRETVNGLVGRNAWRIFWIVVKHSRGLEIRREAAGKRVILTVCESHLETILAELVPIMARRRSRPIRGMTRLFGALIKGIGRRHPVPA